MYLRKKTVDHIGSVQQKYKFKNFFVYIEALGKAKNGFKTSGTVPFNPNTSEEENVLPATIMEPSESVVEDSVLGNKNANLTTTSTNMILCDKGAIT